MTETFKLDFESTVHPGFVSNSELTSFLYLAGLNRTEFRRALDVLLYNHPTGRFPDPTALISQLQAWKIANSPSFTHDDVSTQGSALLASQPTTNHTKSHAVKTAGNIPNTLKPHLHPTPCTWCLAKDKVQRFGHLSAHCFKNPNRVPHPNSTSSPQPLPNYSSGTSQRLRALLTQLDLAATSDASNAVMLLIAEAAIEASESVDPTQPTTSVTHQIPSPSFPVP